MGVPLTVGLVVPFWPSSTQEDNDVTSEHSDSASSLRHSAHHPLASPTLSTEGSSGILPTTALPTTARDRALVDSKAHHHNYSPAYAGMMRPRKVSGGAAERERERLQAEREREREREKTPGSTSPLLRAVAGPSSSSASTGAGPSNPSVRRPTITSSSGASGGAYDPQVTKVLSQASAALSSSTDLTPYAADDEDVSSSTDPLSITPSDSISPPVTARDQTSSTRSGAPGGAAGLHLSTLPAAPLTEAALAHPGSSNITPVAMPMTRSPFAGVAAQARASTASSSAGSAAVQHGREDSDSLSQSGAASEADSVDVDAAHRQPVASGSKPRQGAASEDGGEDGDVSDGGTASPYDGDVEFAARTPVSQQVAHLNNLGLDRDSTTPSPAGRTPTSPRSGDDGTSSVRDVPTRKYSQSEDAPTPTAAHGAEEERTGEATPAEIHAALLRLNSPAKLARFLASGKKASSSGEPASKVKLYLQTRFDVATMTGCTAHLRAAKLCLGGTEQPQQVRVVAGVVAASEQETLQLAQRAGLARGCRWVDEVIEGVPMLSGLSPIARGREEERVRVQAFLKEIGVEWAARFVAVGGSEEVGEDEDDDEDESNVLKLPHFG